jgi:2'-5' RNA ligase
MIRLFAAVDLPDSVKDSIRGICGGLPGARWVDVKQLHLTLRFIGEVDNGLFGSIRASLGEISGSSFSLAVEGTGCFPPKRTPHVLWVGARGNGALSRLAEEIEKTLVLKNGIEPERRPFSPHITIARFKNPSPAKIAEYMARHRDFRTGTFTVNEFHLYSSTLSPAGAVHRKEASYRLK